MIYITSYRARVGEKRRINKGFQSYERRTIWLFIQKYATGLKVSEDMNLKINTIRYVQAIATSLAIDKSVSKRG